MDWLTVLVAAGAIAGILGVPIGLLTWRLSERRSTRNRWLSAKAAIVGDLSPSLGEGAIPDRQIIEATIRSVLREQNASDLAVVSFTEIVDELMRQITADPFLDSERRLELQKRSCKSALRQGHPLPQSSQANIL